jgi:GTP-binding protein Era
VKVAKTKEKIEDGVTTRAGFIAIVGRANVGKSTLLNTVLGTKLAAVSPKPHTTRNRIVGVKNVPGAQLVFVDTPGVDTAGTQQSRGLGTKRVTVRKGRRALDQFVADQALGVLDDADVVLLLVEAPERPLRSGGIPTHVDLGMWPHEQVILERLAGRKKPIILGLNKVDRVADKQQLLPLIAGWSALGRFEHVVPLSGAKGDNVDRLLQLLTEALPLSPPLYPEEMLTDAAERFLAAEFVREQVFLLTRQEVPYASAVTIDTYEERHARAPRPAAKGPHGVTGGPASARDARNKGASSKGRPPAKEPPAAAPAPAPEGVLETYIEATIHVERDTQKAIVVGQGGQMIKEIGTRARQVIGQLLGQPVHLKLWVKVDEEWSCDPNAVRRMGYE